MKSLPLADLEAFAAVAESRNFRKAAALREVSASALSEAVRRLEARLDLRLLNRTTRSVTPTDAGRRLLERIVPMLGEISGALEQARDSAERPAGRLRLNVPGIVARSILPDMAASFLAAYPEISLEIEARDTFVDVFAEGFDAGIRYGENLDLDVIAVPIGPRRQRFAVVASPAYLRARGEPGHPRDVMEHDCIRHRFESGRLSSWEFERDGEVIRVNPEARLIANSSEMELAAAVAGLGLMATFTETVRPHVDDGRLVEVLQDWQQPFSGPFLYYPGRRHMPSPLRAFVDFIKTER